MSSFITFTRTRLGKNQGTEEPKNSFWVVRGDNIADLIKRCALPLELKSDKLRQTAL